MAGLGREGRGGNGLVAAGAADRPPLLSLRGDRLRPCGLQRRAVAQDRRARVMGAYSVPIIVAALVLLTLLRVPIAFAILVAASAGIAMVSGPAALMGVLETAPLSAVSNSEFITVPLFLLRAEFVIIS